MSDRKFYGTLLGLVLGSVLVFGALLWWLTGSLSDGVLRAWSVSSLVLLPGIFWIGWRMGSRDARAYLSGMERGTDHVMRAANQTADLRTANVGQMRTNPRTTVQSAPAVALPQPEVIHVEARQNGGAEVVDL